MERDFWIDLLALGAKHRGMATREWFERGHCGPVVQTALADFRPEERRRRRDRLIERCRAARVHCLTPADPRYPAQGLRRLHDPPAVLFARGDLSRLQEPLRIAVVGARRGTARGRRVASAMGAELARVGITVVSGLALGIDGAAHEGCLAAEGSAIAVLASGADVAYPSQHRHLYERVVAGGLVLSEYEPGSEARKERFVARNRLIAALSQVVVVVEAGERSGALHTVEFAHQVGSDVFAVPGPVDCRHAKGALQLLREGATLVRDGHDVLDSLGFVPRVTTDTPLGLGVHPQSAVEIATRLQWPLDRVLAALGEAELLGQVRRAGIDAWVLASALPTPGRRP